SGFSPRAPPRFSRRRILHRPTPGVPDPRRSFLPSLGTLSHKEDREHEVRFRRRPSPQGHPGDPRRLRGALRPGVGGPLPLRLSPPRGDPPVRAAMHVDLYEKIWMWGAGALVMLFVGAIARGAVSGMGHPP